MVTYGYEHYDRARHYFEDGQYLDAARELEELFTDVAAARAETPEGGDGRDPVGHGLSEPRLLLARAYYHSAQLRRAEEAARQVLDEDPQDAYAHLLLGRTLVRAGRSDEAKGPLRMAELLGGYETTQTPGAEVSDEGI